MSSALVQYRHFAIFKGSRYLVIVKILSLLWPISFASGPIFVVVVERIWEFVLNQHYLGCCYDHTKQVCLLNYGPIVMEGDSCPEGCGFVSQHCILDRHFHAYLL